MKKLNKRELLGTTNQNKIGNFLKRRSIPLVASGAILTAAGLFAGSGTSNELASSTTPTSTTMTPASTTTTVASYAAADQAAITWASANASGTGSVTILKTEPDTEGTLNIPVYDITLVAANGNTYVVTVQVSNDAVLTAHLAETPPPTTTTTVPPITVPPIAGASAADQAAIAWASVNASGTGTVRILKTEPDTEGPSHTAVYDINLIAANGNAYVVTVQMSNEAIVSAQLAEGQPTTSKSEEHGETSATSEESHKPISSVDQNKTSSSSNQNKTSDSVDQNKTSSSSTTSTTSVDQNKTSSSSTTSTTSVDQNKTSSSDN